MRVPLCSRARKLTLRQGKGKETCFEIYSPLLNVTRGSFLVEERRSMQECIAMNLGKSRGTGACTYEILPGNKHVQHFLHGSVNDTST